MEPPASLLSTIFFVFECTLTVPPALTLILSSSFAKTSATAPVVKKTSVSSVTSFSACSSPPVFTSVSYTHLTLPTIYSV